MLPEQRVLPVLQFILQSHSMPRSDASVTSLQTNTSTYEFHRLGHLQAGRGMLSG